MESIVTKHYALDFDNFDSKMNCPEIVPVKSVDAIIDRKEHFTIPGKRIVNISMFFDQILMISAHDKQCSFNNLVILSIKDEGLNANIKVKCLQCKKLFSLYTCEKPGYSEEMSVNYSAVLGSIVTGNGDAQLKEIFANIAIPCMCPATYKKWHDIVAIDLKLTADECMKKAVECEKQIAQSKGCFDEEGEHITVATDGCWSKRSYGSGYSAQSGSASIIGVNTKKVLWSAVRNKNCIGCNQNILNHKCNRNFSGPSTGMESDILVEGWKLSLPLYKIKYTTFVADGDSSVYKRILDLNPYREKVEKIDCRNHLMRNVRKKIRELVSNTSYTLFYRKKFKSKMKQIDRAIFYSIHYWKNEKTLPLNERIKMLEKDLLNIPQHIFGQHSNCADYFKQKCNVNETNIFEEVRLERSNILEKFTGIINSIASKSNSLIVDVDQNICEQFHSNVAKCVGGKRVNFTISNSYEARTMAAIIQHNTGRVHSTVHEQVFGSSANT